MVSQKVRIIIFIEFKFHYFFLFVFLLLLLFLYSLPFLLLITTPRFFVERLELDPRFPFDRYLKTCTKHLFTELAQVHWSTLALTVFSVLGLYYAFSDPSIDVCFLLLSFSFPPFSNFSFPPPPPPPLNLGLRPPFDYLLLNCFLLGWPFTLENTKDLFKYGGPERKGSRFFENFG